jgi:hypothetical protein
MSAAYVATRLPVGQITKSLSIPLAKNILLPSRPKSSLCSALSRALQEGRFAIVTDVGCGMRWTQERAKTNGAFADGEVVWS